MRRYRSPLSVSSMHLHWPQYIVIGFKIMSFSSVGQDFFLVRPLSFEATFLPPLQCLESRLCEPLLTHEK
jgi:hypothetical protein